MLTFPNVTPAVFALVLDQLRTEATVTEAAPFSGTQSWDIEGNGIKAQIMRSQNLNYEWMTDVSIASKPWWMTEGMIGAKIRDAITLAQQAVAKAGRGGEAA